MGRTRQRRTLGNHQGGGIKLYSSYFGISLNGQSCSTNVSFQNMKNGSGKMSFAQKTIKLFGVGVPAISKHLKNIFEENELNPKVVVSKMEITTQHGAIEGKTQKSETSFYSLDAIIAVGYRVSSLRATRFRQWATKILNEYIRKGFALDDDRLKQGTAVFGKDYFRELLERVRSIRASERRIWQQITDIYAEWV